MMGVLAKHNKQSIYIYSESSKLGRRILPFVEALNLPIRCINIDREPLTDNIWLEIASMLDKPLGSIFMKYQPKTDRIFNVDENSAGEWLKIIAQYPDLLEFPVAIKEGEAKILKYKFDFYNFYEQQDRIDSEELVKIANSKALIGFKSAM